MRVRIITVSDRCHAGTAVDRSGPLAAELFGAQGFSCDDVVVVPDQAPAIAAAVRAGVTAGCGLVVTTGGTGLAPRDVTPEAVAPLLERAVPGIAEAIRLVSREAVPTAVLSRGVAGVVGQTLVVTLPGSPGGVRDGIAVLAPLVAHAVSQLAGNDHEASPGLGPAGGGSCVSRNRRPSVPDPAAFPGNAGEPGAAGTGGVR